MREDLDLEALPQQPLQPRQLIDGHRQVNSRARTGVSPAAYDSRAGAAAGRGGVIGSSRISSVSPAARKAMQAADTKAAV